MTDLRHQKVRTNGIELHVVDAGPADGPAVVLSHGFPELWYSWRHQIPALAEAGYHVIAPDQRGYGESDRPAEVEDYGIQHLTADLLGLLDHFGHDDCVFVGHDWGALIAWGMVRLHPDRIRAMLAMSVPLFSPPTPPVEHFRAAAGDDFYVVQFQKPGFEAGFDADPHATMRAVLTNLPADPDSERPSGRLEAPSGALPDWITEADIAYYGDAFARTGFFGGVSYYRNVDANWRLMKDLPYDAMSMPIAFMTGSLDWVHRSPWGGVAGTEKTGIAAMEELLPDFRGTTFIEGAGHWNQQEKAADTNAGVLAFLEAVAPVGAR